MSTMGEREREISGGVVVIIWKEEVVEERNYFLGSTSVAQTRKRLPTGQTITSRVLI